MVNKKKSQTGSSEELSVGIEIPLAAIAGCLFGVGAIFMKMATGPAGTFQVSSAEAWMALLTNLAFWIMVVANAGGLITWFWALSEGRVAVVGPFMSGFMVMIPVIVGLTYFGEALTLTKGIGILTITIGGMFLSRR